MDMVALQASARSTETRPSSLRSQNLVPCVVYGNEVTNTPIQCHEKDLTKAYAKAGESTLIELELGGKKIPCLVYDITFDPLKETITHVDFYAVNMKKEIEASVPLHVEGVSPAVKDLAGVLVYVHDHLTVTCLPSNLPHSITVSIDSLATFDDAITVADVQLPDGVTVAEEPDTVLLMVQEPRKEEAEVAPVAAEGEAAAAPAEGEAAAAPAAEKKE